jgi:hypothetical protein
VAEWNAPAAIVLSLFRNAGTPPLFAYRRAVITIQT